MSAPEQTFNAFAVGDTIFVPSVQQKEIEVQCPDCLGSKTWSISTPAGMSKEIPCPRCEGGARNWFFPKRYERSLEIQEVTVSEVSIRCRKHHKEDGVYTYVEYSTSPYAGHIGTSRVFATHAEAAAAGELMMAEAADREHAEWKKEREREEARAGKDIIAVLQAKANDGRAALEANVAALREKLFDAIRYPSLYGPKLTHRSYGSTEITSQAMADWLQQLLGDAGLETWSETELHEAMCHC